MRGVRVAIVVGDATDGVDYLLLVEVGVEVEVDGG